MINPEDTETFASRDVDKHPLLNILIPVENFVLL